MSYFLTHCHTQYSNITAGLDCMNKLDDLVKKAKELGLSGIAITNHDNLSEVIGINRKQKELRKNGDNFTIAIGNELYLIDAYANDIVSGKAERQKYYHFILIAKDKIGYDAIVELSSRAWYRSEVRFGRRRVPTFKRDVEEIIGRCKGHVVATTACLGGELATNLNEGKTDVADAFVEWALGVFGYDDFYIELQPSERPDQNRFNMAALTRYPDIKTLIATDAHYQDKEDYAIFEAFMRSQQETRDIQEFYEFARLMSKDEAKSYMKEYNPKWIEECFNNTEIIRSQIQFYDLAQDPKIPSAPLIQPERIWMNGLREAEIKGYPTLQWAAASQDEQTAFCIHTCLNQLVERDLWNKQYLDRLEEEFEVMKFQSEQIGDNFFKYANTMRHYLDLAWSIDCAVGPSRGSASGSLLNYLMDIVQCDPIQYELPFWRYLNKTRVTPLDIDTDFQPSKRPELFAAIRAERGELGLTQVATFRKLTLKAAIGNAARGYRAPDCPNGLDSDISTYLSSLIEIKRGFVATLEQTLEGDEVTDYKINHTFIKECSQYPGLLEIIRKIEGIVVGSSTHAAAVVLFDDQDRLFNHCSLMRAPNGDLCTALDLYTVEEAGCYKYDFLMLSTLDIQATCFKLLQKNGVIPAEYTLKQCFRTYINPNTLDFDQPEIWEKLYNNEVLSIFQWDAASGRKGIIATKPQSLAELTAANGLIRLMTADGEEDQIQRFVRIKNDPSLFEQEMIAVGLNDEQRRIMHEELDQYNGCAATQESFMVLSQKLAGYTLKQADALRKTVAKKKMEEITAQKELFFEQLGNQSETIKEYLWQVIIAPSLGYGFSLNHALPYSIIGVQCILMGGVLFDPIYWQTACLLQRSGALDGKTADYNKIAKAVSLLSKQGVDIRPVDINTSEREFSLDVKKKIIHFGLDGVKGLKTKVIEQILEQRPFESMLDFIVRTNADITSIVTLIKAGAFDEFDSRERHIDIIARMRGGQKEKLNGQNLAMLSREGYWPTDTEELKTALRVFNFTQYLKQMPNGLIYNMGLSLNEWYQLDDRARTFLDEMGYEHDGKVLNKKAWKYYYDIAMKPIKRFLIENQDEMLDRINENFIQQWKDKYFPNNDFAQWEIETMGLCFRDHPMAHVINVSDFDDLPQEPEISNIFRPKNSRRSIPLYKLTMICGIVVAKDKLHSTITILTATGPVDVKFRKEQFAHYDAQISQQVNGKKQIVERSWLNRGNGLIVHGMRQDDLFVAKTYRNSPMEHTAFKITKVLNTGKLEVQKERKKGYAEDPEEDDDE